MQNIKKHFVDSCHEGKQGREGSELWKLQVVDGHHPLSEKDVACQVNFFEEGLCLKNTQTVASQTEENTVNVEMITPLLLEKTVDQW